MSSKADMIKVFAVQQEIIALQTKTISRLFEALLQHTAFEEGNPPELLKDIEEADRLKKIVGDLE